MNTHTMSNLLQTTLNISPCLYTVRSHAFKYKSHYFHSAHVTARPRSFRLICTPVMNVYDF